MSSGDRMEIHQCIQFLFKSYMFVNQIINHVGNCTEKARLSSSELSGSLHKKGKLINHTAPITYLRKQSN